MERVIQLPLYGAVPHGEREDMAWQLYQTEGFSRLRDISLSSVPSRFAPNGQAASRFSHSVAVGMLARQLADEHPGRLSAHARTLEAAGLCHDLGSTPFSHIGEVFLWDATGETHEQRTLSLLAAGGEIAGVLGDYDVDPEMVVAAITGQHPLLGPLIAGSLDLDNIDNSLHLLLSLGHAPSPLPYHPRVLVSQALTVTDHGATLKVDGLGEVLGWARTRQLLYAVLQSEAQQSSATMLYRALEFARAGGELPTAFFGWGEGQALAWMEAEVGGATKQLTDALRTWRQYPRLLSRTSADPDPRLFCLYDDWALRHAFTNELAGRLDIPAVELCLYAGRDRGAKAVRLPWQGDRAEHAAGLFSASGGHQHLALYAHKHHHGRLTDADVSGALDELLDDLPVRAEGHAFF